MVNRLNRENLIEQLVFLFQEKWNENPARFGAFFIKFCQEAAINRQELAKEFNITVQRIAEWQYRRTLFTQKKAVQMAVKLGTMPEAFYGVVAALQPYVEENEEAVGPEEIFKSGPRSR